MTNDDLRGLKKKLNELEEFKYNKASTQQEHEEISEKIRKIEAQIENGGPHPQLKIEFDDKS